nr:hypothetical protein BaRGS_024402 [Batillaria attramentaria]
MQKMNIQPDLPLYNLFIRCVRDCGVGEATTLTDLLGDTASAPSTPELTSGKRNTANDIALLESRDSSRCSLQSAGEISSSSQSLGDAENHHEDMDEFQQYLEQKSKADIDSDVLQIDQNSDMSLEHLAQSVSTAPTIPDLLSPNCDVSGVVSLGDLSSKESQLALVGGVEGILGRMVEDNVKPDIITFSQLITVAVPTVEAEERVLEFMKKMKVKPDIDLLNALIHKRCMRWDFEAARDVQQMISEYKLTPNQRTFGVLAMTCRSQPDAALLLHDMEACELQPNKEILGTLIYAARTNFKYMLWVVREAEKLDLAPNTKFLQNIEKALAYTRKMIVLAERKGEIDSYFLSPHCQQSYESFKEYYDKWLQRIGVDVPPHPWATFRPKQDDDEKQQAAKTV